MYYNLPIINATREIVVKTLKYKIVTNFILKFNYREKEE